MCPMDYTKIQWAVDNASAGDTIIVRNGTYYENVVVANKRITLQGEDRSGAVIDGKGTGNVITLVESPGVVIRGFKSNDGDGTAEKCDRRGSTLYVRGTAELLLRNVTDK